MITANFPRTRLMLQLSRSDKVKDQFDLSPFWTKQAHVSLHQNKDKTVNPVYEILTSLVDEVSVARGVDVVARVHVGDKDACTTIGVK